jgi:hypothetical protein
MAVKKPPNLPPPINPLRGGTHRPIVPNQTQEQLERKGSVDYYWPRWRTAKQFAASAQESRSLTLVVEYLNRISKQDGGLGERTDKRWIEQSRAQLDSALDRLKVPASDPIRPAHLLGQAVLGQAGEVGPWVRDRDRQMAKIKTENPARYPRMTAREAAAALQLSKSAIYEHPLLERAGTGASKVLFTTKSVLAVKNSSPE